MSDTATDAELLPIRSVLERARYAVLLLSADHVLPEDQREVAMDAVDSITALLGRPTVENRAAVEKIRQLAGALVNDRREKIDRRELIRNLNEWANDLEKDGA